MDERLVTIARFGSPVHANLARAQLESAGIRAFVQNELGSLHGPMADIELQVYGADRANALAVLGQTLPAARGSAAGAAGADADDDWRMREEPERCPICEASLVQYHEPPLPLRLLRFLLTLFLPLPARLFASRGRSCGVCGYRWREGDSGVPQIPTMGG